MGAIEEGGAEAVIPARKNVEVRREIGTDRYRGRNPVERFWAELKRNRRVATRYEKTDRNFLGFVYPCSAMILLQ